MNTEQVSSIEVRRRPVASYSHGTGLGCFGSVELHQRLHSNVVIVAVSLCLCHRTFLSLSKCLPHCVVLRLCVCYYTAIHCSLRQLCFYLLPSACLSASLFRPSVFMFVFVYLSVCLSVWRLPPSVYISLVVYLFVFLSVYLSVYLSVCPSVCTQIVDL